jgi:hypothetical protein
MSRLYHPSWLDYSTYTWRIVQVMKPLSPLPLCAIKKTRDINKQTNFQMFPHSCSGTYSNSWPKLVESYSYVKINC